MPQLLDKMPAAIADRLRTRFGRQFSRFAVVAVASLVTSEIVLSIAYLAGATPGVSGLIGWLAGAAVSYVLSRWAWRRKGKPNLLKETLPFWAVSIGTAAVLSTATHFGGHFAKSEHLGKTDSLLVVASAYLVANFVTFMTRFLIFHYVLFAERGDAAASGHIDAESLELAVTAAPAATEPDEQAQGQ
jgi:putative flippase GtrA